MELTVEKIREAHRLQEMTEVKCDDTTYWGQEACISFLLAKLDTKERETAERCVELIKDNMASKLGVDRSWTSFAEEAIRNEFLKEKDND